MIKTSKALFLDRDGVINVDTGYTYQIEDCKFVDGIFELVKKAKALDYLIIVITNQSGIGYGYYTEKDFWIFMNFIKEKFIKKGGTIDDIFFCPFHGDAVIEEYKIDNHPNRKPNPGMILEAVEKHNIDLTQSMLIGDKEIDIKAGESAGVGRCVLVANNDLSLAYC